MLILLIYAAICIPGYFGFRALFRKQWLMGAALIVLAAIIQHAALGTFY